MLGKMKYEEVSHMYSCLVTELQMALQKLQKYKPPGTDQIPEEMIQAGDIKYVVMYMSQ
jgi:hypothetical protein